MSFNDPKTPEKNPNPKKGTHPILKALPPEDVDRIIEMAWEDRTPFGAIKAQFGLPEKSVIELMRRQLKRSSFNRWRKRVSGRATKHRLKRPFEEGRFKCSRQRSISMNKISKRY